MSGLEIVGAVASITQLASLVYSISKQLYEVSSALSAAPSDIKDLARDLEVFHEELVLHSDLAKDNLRCSNQIVRLTTKIIGRCAEICVKIDDILRKLRSGSVWAKIKWIYKEKEIVKLLTRLRDLKLSLMGVLSLLNLAKTDHLIDRLGVTQPSVFEAVEEESPPESAIGDIEDTRGKFAQISIYQRFSQTKNDTADGHDQIQNYSGNFRGGEAARVVTDDEIVQPSPASLGWTTPEDVLQKYMFIVKKGKEPYFRLVSEEPTTKNTPERVFLDKPQNLVEGTYPCMYPGGCNGRHVFFEAIDLERHYCLVHSGKEESPGGSSPAGSQSPTLIQNLEQETTSHTNHQLLKLKGKRAVREASEEPDDAVSTIITPSPVRDSQHALPSVQPSRTAVTDMASHIKSKGIGSDNVNLWRQKLIHSAVEHFGMTREDAKSWAMSLPVPTTAVISSSVQDLPRPPREAASSYTSNTRQRDNMFGHSSESKAYQPAPSQSYFPPAEHQGYSSGWEYYFSSSAASDQPLAEVRAKKPENPRRDESTETLGRTNEYFIPKSGIDREVITADICRYLGNDAEVRPGTYENPQTRQTQEGYFLKAYRNLTTAMIDDLKADSARWDAEKRRADLLKESTAGPLAIHDKDLVTGGNLSAETVSRPLDQQPSAAAYAQPVTSAYYASSSSNRRERDPDTMGNMPRTSAVYHGKAPTSEFQAAHLWAQALAHLQKKDDKIAQFLFERWFYTRVWSSHSSAQRLTDPRIAKLYADDLLSLLTLSEDQISETNENEGELSAHALESVKTITGIIEVIKSTLEFKVGSFIWTLFCGVLRDIVMSDQQNSTARSEPILPHMAMIATLIARYNVLESIYLDLPSMTLDATLKNNLIEMCALVLLFLYGLESYHQNNRPGEEEDVLRRLDEYIVGIQRADDECRRFTVRILDSDVADSVEDGSDEEERDCGSIADERGIKHGRSDLEYRDMGVKGIGYDDYDDRMTGAKGEPPKAKRLRF